MNEDSFKCNNCGKQFALEQLLRDHIILIIYMKGGDSLRIANSEADPSESARSVRPGLYRTSPPVSSEDWASWSHRVP